MSGYRLTGAIVGLISMGLLIWVIVLTFTQNDLVTPTVNVKATASQQTARATTGQATAGQPPAQTASAQEILAARTRLMKDRSQSGSDAFPPLSGGDHKIAMEQGVKDGRNFVQTWQGNEPPYGVLRDRDDVRGNSSLPYRNAASFQQPGGRTWRAAHNEDLRYGGGWLIFGMLFALAFFLFARGRVPLAEGFSGRTIERFNGLERANHWMTASSFIVMGITGLIILYGKPVLLPWVGEPGFGTLASWSAWLHMASTVPFVLGVIIMIVVWLVQNLPSRLDWEWLKRFGGFLRNDGNNPPARRFNAGQKIVFWGVVLSAILLLLSGISLMFPFYWFGYDGMQSAQTFHAVVALLIIALIFGHIYIGTIGMEGAFDAMWSGQVDRNWAKEHHKIWYQEVVGGKPPESERPRDGRAPAPAE